MPRTARGERFGPAVALGAGIRARRRALGLSQESLASVSGLDRTYVGGLERGERNPTLKVLWKLATALEVPPSELIGLAERKL